MHSQISPLPLLRSHLTSLPMCVSLVPRPSHIYSFFYSCGFSPMRRKLRGNFIFNGCENSCTGIFSMAVKKGAREGLDTRLYIGV